MQVLLEQETNHCRRTTATGVDLDRNFDWNWGGEGSSGSPGHEEYRGSHPFSEPESTWLKALASQKKYFAFFSIHSGEQQGILQR